MTDNPCISQTVHRTDAAGAPAQRHWQPAGRGGPDVVAGAAFAQGPSTGNPKGSVAPSTQGSSANPPAERARTVDTGRSDPWTRARARPRRA
jgi:hypothetical protein